MTKTFAPERDELNERRRAMLRSGCRGEAARAGIYLWTFQGEPATSDGNWLVRRGYAHVYDCGGSRRLLVATDAGRAALEAVELAERTSPPRSSAEPTGGGATC